MEHTLTHSDGILWHGTRRQFRHYLVLNIPVDKLTDGFLISSTLISSFESGVIIHRLYCCIQLFSPCFMCPPPMAGVRCAKSRFSFFIFNWVDLSTLIHCFNIRLATILLNAEREYNFEVLSAGNVSMMIIRRRHEEKTHDSQKITVHFFNDLQNPFELVRNSKVKRYALPLVLHQLRVYYTLSDRPIWDRYHEITTVIS